VIKNEAEKKIIYRTGSARYFIPSGTGDPFQLMDGNDRDPAASGFYSWGLDAVTASEFGSGTAYNNVDNRISTVIPYVSTVRAGTAANPYSRPLVTRFLRDVEQNISREGRVGCEIDCTGVRVNNVFATLPFIDEPNASQGDPSANRAASLLRSPVIVRTVLVSFKPSRNRFGVRGGHSRYPFPEPVSTTGNINVNSKVGSISEELFASFFKECGEVQGFRGDLRDTYTSLNSEILTVYSDTKFTMGGAFTEFADINTEHRRGIDARAQKYPSFKRRTYSLPKSHVGKLKFVPLTDFEEQGTESIGVGQFSPINKPDIYQMSWMVPVDAVASPGSTALNMVNTAKQYRLMTDYCVKYVDT
jgi:hypothetical protein